MTARVLTDVAGQPHIVAINKSDLPTFSVTRAHDEILSAKPLRIVSVSAKTEGDLKDLHRYHLTLSERRYRYPGTADHNARHHDSLRCAVGAVDASEELLRTRASEELILVGLHNALRFLGEITGETTSDEILGQIFSTFVSASE